MDDSDAATPRIRRDGWTAERQLRFLAALADTASVSAAAAAAGMSRESAYRLRSRRQGLLFAHLWDRILQPDPATGCEGHTPALSDRRLARLLGIQFRRERGDYRAIGSPSARLPGQ